MGRRTKARECAFQLLYQWELTREPMGAVLEGFWRLRSGTPQVRAMAERLAVGAQARAGELDAAIAEAATHWRIDRIALFRAQKGLRMRDDHTFSIEEYNTYACPWHNNLTAAVMSFRRAKALDWVAGSFVWERSLRFDWTSRQLLELGMIEPGQWF